MQAQDRLGETEGAGRQTGTMPIYQPHIYTRVHGPVRRAHGPSLYQLISHLRSRLGSARRTNLLGYARNYRCADIRLQRASVEGRSAEGNPTGSRRGMGSVLSLVFEMLEVKLRSPTGESFADYGIVGIIRPTARSVFLYRF